MLVITNRHWSPKKQTFTGREAAEHALTHLEIGEHFVTGEPYQKRMRPAAFRRQALDYLQEQQVDDEPPLALVMIHGYCTDYDRSLEFFANLNSRLNPTHHALPVGFSWPSAGSLPAYIPDRKRALSSAIALTDAVESALRLLQREQCPAQLVVVAHSMGAYVLACAADLAIKTTGLAGFKAFNEVLLVAPDLDNNVFDDERSFAMPLAQLSRRVTIYRSDHDFALKASMMKRGGFTGPRLGQRGADPTRLPSNVIQVDASLQTNTAEAHGEHFRALATLSDMQDVIAGHDRDAISGRVKRDNGEYYLTSQPLQPSEEWTDE